jgi:hypothetical protein
VRHRAGEEVRQRTLRGARPRKPIAAAGCEMIVGTVPRLCHNSAG